MGGLSARSVQARSNPRAKPRACVASPGPEERSEQLTSAPGFGHRSGQSRGRDPGQIPALRPTGVRFVTCFSTSIVLVLASITLPAPTRLAGFGLALIIVWWIYFEGLRPKVPGTGYRVPSAVLSAECGAVLSAECGAGRRVPSTKCRAECRVCTQHSAP